jgi:hypothetical protein
MSAGVKAGMKIVKMMALIGAGVVLAGCEGVFGGQTDQTIDRGFDSKNVLELKAGIWVDPNGCDHWIIDDGIEGYLSQRLSRDGKPVCSGVAPPNHIDGDFKRGSSLADFI